MTKTAEDKQTGRTTELLKRAIEIASDGKTVYFVVPAVAMIPYCFSLVKYLTSGACVASSRNSMKIGDHGFIRFVPKFHEFLRRNENGLVRVIGSDADVILDHAVMTFDIS